MKQEESGASQAPVAVEGIGQIAITVSDMARSKDFYGTALGLKFLFDAGKMAFYQCGEVRLMLGTSDQPVMPGGTILYFKVADIHAAHARLAERRVPILGPPHLVAKMADHDLWMEFLRDPDGYTVALMSEVRPPVS
jgi:methylmalonyl-CoA/ethylmalonyl-CoA epimerase